MFYFLTIFCRDINPDVEFEAYNYNITLLENFKHFLCRIRWVNFNMFKIVKNLKNSFRLAWENSRHLVILPLVSPPNNIWEMSTEIPYGWSITTQIWVVLLIGCTAWEIWFNQSEALPRSRVVTRHQHGFLHSFLRHHLAGKPVVGSPNVSCFLRLPSDKHFTNFAQLSSPCCLLVYH